MDANFKTTISEEINYSVDPSILDLRDERQSFGEASEVIIEEDSEKDIVIPRRNWGSDCIQPKKSSSCLAYPNIGVENDRGQTHDHFYRHRTSISFSDDDIDALLNGLDDIDSNRSTSPKPNPTFCKLNV